jgi:hypothetical protein
MFKGIMSFFKKDELKNWSKEEKSSLLRIVYDVYNADNNFSELEEKEFRENLSKLKLSWKEDISGINLDTAMDILKKDPLKMEIVYSHIARGVYSDGLYDFKEQEYIKNLALKYDLSLSKLESSIVLEKKRRVDSLDLEKLEEELLDSIDNKDISDYIPRTINRYKKYSYENLNHFMGYIKDSQNTWTENELATMLKLVFDIYQVDSFSPEETHNFQTIVNKLKIPSSTIFTMDIKSELPNILRSENKTNVLNLLIANAIMSDNIFSEEEKNLIHTYTLKYNLDEENILQKINLLKENLINKNELSAIFEML